MAPAKKTNFIPYKRQTYQYNTGCQTSRKESKTWRITIRKTKHKLKMEHVKLTKLIQRREKYTHSRILKKERILGSKYRRKGHRLDGIWWRTRKGRMCLKESVEDDGGSCKRKRWNWTNARMCWNCIYKRRRRCQRNAENNSSSLVTGKKPSEINARMWLKTLK